ncbi:MAG: hypothetical protein HYX93_03840 [Chloroflexi bacterium]|nr:hypothetical protein [Chloroflexota bacterium]
MDNVRVARGWPVHIAIHREAAGAALLLALLSAISLHRWALMAVETAPPGSDGGNWLAFSAELFGHQVKAAHSTYPPVFPFLLRWFAMFLPDLTALKVLGLLSAAFVSVPVYLLLRASIHPILAASLAGVSVAADYPAGVLAWGGYPQLLGVGFLVLAVYLLLRALRTGHVVHYGASALFVALTVSTHLLAAALLLFAVATVLIINVYTRWGSATWRLVAPQRRRLLLWGIGVAIILLPLVPFYARMVGLMDGNPTNPHGFSFLRALTELNLWHIQYYMWASVAVACLPVVLAVLVYRRSMLAEAAAALSVAGLLVLALQSEIRSVHLVQVGLVLAVGVTLSSAIEYGHGQLSAGKRRMLNAATIALVAAFLTGATLFGELRINDDFQWYSVLDGPALEAMDWIREHKLPGDRAVANQTPREGIYGWWVEGYAGVPTYLAVDTRWLSFREEKEQAEIALRFLDPAATPEQLKGLVKGHAIRFLLLDKQTLPQPWPPYDEAGFVLGLENENMLVMVSGGGGPGE